MKIERDMELLQKVLEKYGFTAPLPPEVRKDIYTRKRKILVNILKKYGRYNPFIAVSLSVFFLMKAVGFSLTLAQSAGILILAGALTAATVTGGAYYVVKKYVLQPVAVQVPSSETRYTSAEPKKGSPSPLVPAYVYFAPVEASAGVEDDVSARVNASFSMEITLRKGPGSVAYAPSASAARGVAITIEKAGDTYILTARLVDRATGRILHIYNETGPASTLDEMARKIARDIIDVGK